MSITFAMIAHRNLAAIPRYVSVKFRWFTGNFGGSPAITDTRQEPGEMLRTTALVHEAYLRLVDIEDVDWQDRTHFFAVSAQLITRVAVDAARARGAAKRDGQAGVVDNLNLDQIPSPDSERAAELIALDDALFSLVQLAARRAQVVELRVLVV